MNTLHSNFTFTDYRNLLKDAKKKYRFISYDDDINQENICIWRHDVDFSIENALQLSEIEKNEKLSCIYFIQLSSNFYNVFDPFVLEALKKIIADGHLIGLHFYPELYKINSEEDLAKALSFEKDILEKLIQREVKFYSYHNPTPDILQYDKFKYANMINAYSSRIRKDFAYCSDSNGYWRYDSLHDFLMQNHSRIQILTHPVWWSETQMLPRQKLEKHLNDKSVFLLEWYDDILNKFGRKNIGKDKA